MLSLSIKPLRAEIIQLMNNLVEKSCAGELRRGAGGKRITPPRTRKNESIGMQSDSRLYSALILSAGGRVEPLRPFAPDDPRAPRTGGVELLAISQGGGVGVGVGGL